MASLRSSRALVPRLDSPAWMHTAKGALCQFQQPRFAPQWKPAPGLRRQFRHTVTPTKQRPWRKLDMQITPEDLRLLRDRWNSNTNNEALHHSIDEYAQCVRTISDAVNSGSPNWVQVLPPDQRPSVELLHETGIFLLRMHWTSWRIMGNWACWTGASELGYIQSTLSLARDLVAKEQYGKWPYFKSIEARFREAVAKGDSNALTVEGQRLLLQGKSNAAIEVLKRALERNGGSSVTSESGFDWEGECHLHIGTAYRKLGQTDKALDEYREAAELGVDDAFVALGTNSPDYEESRRYMYAAASQQPRLFGYLSEWDLEKAGQTTDKDAKQEHLLWAAEWTRLMNSAVKNGPQRKR